MQAFQQGIAYFGWSLGGSEDPTVSYVLNPHSTLTAPRIAL